jgi:hypothetical protein
MTRGATLPSLMARLVVALYLLAGLLPAGGFVLCIDGRAALALEASTAAGSCSDCSDSSPCSTGADPRAGGGCDCIDIAVARPADHERTVRVVSARIAPPVLDGTALAPLVPPSFAVLAPRNEEPRPPGVLGALRTVVLLV